MAHKFIFKIKVKSIQDPFILENERGQAFKARWDDKEKDLNAQIMIGEEWSGTWRDIAWVQRELVKIAESTPKKDPKDYGKPYMTFQQFAEKHPEKVKEWEESLGKRWDGSKFVPR